jgi:very-short-patch-repair endonuclease
MSDTREDKRSRRAWELAWRQHGIVTRRQLLALKFNSREIEHRISRRRLHVVMRGVYAVGWPELTERRRWMAAVLACGEGAALSHQSAAALWGIGKEQRGRIDVSVRRRSELERPGLRIRARAKLDPARIVAKDGIPATEIVQTLVDLATELAPRRLERAINEADKHELIDPETLRSRLGSYEGEPGIKPLRTLLDKRTFRLSDSDLEILFRPISAEAGLPFPLSKQIVNDWEVDFYWPDLGLVVETDGLRYHRTASTQTRDARRDRAHALAGMTPLRFTHYEVKHEPTQVRQELRRAAAMRQARVSEIDHT